MSPCMSLLSWFTHTKPTPKTISIPPFAAALGRPLTKTAQGHWFLQLTALTAQQLVCAWQAHATHHQDRWLIIDPLGRLNAIQAPGACEYPLWRFAPAHPEDIAAVIEVVSQNKGIDAVLLLDLERLQGLWGEHALVALWKQIQRALTANICIIQAQILDWGAGPDDTLTPIDDLLSPRRGTRN